MESKKVIGHNKIFAWIALATLVFLTILFVAMQFNSSIDWKWQDFVLAGGLLWGGGSLAVLVARKLSGRLGLLVGLILLLAVALVWVHLALGIEHAWPFSGS